MLVGWSPTEKSQGINFNLEHNTEIVFKPN